MSVAEHNMRQGFNLNLYGKNGERNNLNKKPNLNFGSMISQNNNDSPNQNNYTKNIDQLEFEQNYENFDNNFSMLDNTMNNKKGVNAARKIFGDEESTNENSFLPGSQQNNRFENSYNNKNYLG